MKLFFSSVVALGWTTSCVSGHGLVSQPGSRNWFCGALCKPHGQGCAAYPECSDAFANDWNGGYQFMSVLTHDIGRGGIHGSVSPLPKHVCGFDSETWQGGATPWDSTGVDWPTTTIDLDDGPLKIVWDISWGPHFSDTEEFVHYITKDDFVYDPDRALTWDDFEDEPFCVLSYDHSSPGANPDVNARINDAEFDTWCTIPQDKANGRHVIYAEWGRNEWTFERFHGCMDVVLTGGVPVEPTTAAPVAPTPAPVAVAPVAPAPKAPVTSNSLGIPYPCCGWNGDCQQPENQWCHAACGQCTGTCNGVFYTASGSGTVTCEDVASIAPVAPVSPPVEPPLSAPAASAANPIELPAETPVGYEAVPEIPYPCCGWNGNCQHPDNAYCHSGCDQCTGPCNGVFYAARGVASYSCEAGDDNQGDSLVACCTWGGWNTCPGWTQTSSDPCQRSEERCIGCSGRWISGSGGSHRNLRRGPDHRSSSPVVSDVPMVHMRPREKAIRSL